MKLNTRFSLLFILISIVTIAIPLCIFKGEHKISQLIKYNNLIEETNITVNNISSFSTNVLYYGYNFETIKNHWEQNYNKLTDLTDKLKNNKIISSFSEETTANIQLIITTLTVIESRMNKISNSYEKISSFKYPNSFITSSITKNGLKQTVSLYKNSYLNQNSDIFEKLHSEINLISQPTKDIQSSRTLLASIFSKLGTNIQQEINSETKKLFSIGIFFSIVLSIIIFILAYFTTNKLVKRIKKIQKATSSLANKNLINKYNSQKKDEVGILCQDLAVATDNLDKVLISVKENIQKVVISSTKINEATSDTAAASFQINSGVKHLVKQIETISETTDTCMNALKKVNMVGNDLIANNKAQSLSITENDNSINSIVSEIKTISNLAERKSENTKQMQTYIMAGDEKISNTTELLSIINGKLDEVTDIITLINQVAEQTNLLAMNAAIESAHAGDAGKGFAVVAEEIRNLSETTKENSNSINKSISDIIEQVHSANEMSKEASGAFVKVRTESEDLIDSLNEITKNIKNVESQSLSITTHTKDLSESSKLVTDYCEELSSEQNLLTQNMSNLESIMTESKTGANEIKTSISDISKMIQDINNLTCDNSEKMKILTTSINEFTTSPSDNITRDEHIQTNIPYREEQNDNKITQNFDLQSDPTGEPIANISENKKEDHTEENKQLQMEEVDISVFS